MESDVDIADIDSSEIGDYSPVIGIVQRQCSICRQPGHNKRTCPNNVSNTVKNFKPNNALPIIKDLVSESIAGVCDTCRRTSTEHYNLDICFDQDAYKYSWKAFGNIARIGKLPCYLCKECRQYYITGRSAEFQIAWPAVIWSLLSGRQQMKDVEKFICFLPTNIRQMFHYSRERISMKLRNILLFHEPVSIDVTQRVDEFKQFMTPGNMKAPKCWFLLRKYWKFDMICPMGCGLMTGDTHNQILPVTHYIHFLDEETRILGGDRSWLSGKRPTWPEKINIMGLYDGYAGVVIDDKLGLCFMTCGDKVHKMKGLQYIHVPRSPALLMCTNRQDSLALAVCTGNFKKGINIGSCNTSQRVLKQSGCQAGMSTTTIHSRPFGNLTLLEDEQLQAAVVLQYRSDVRHQMLTVTDYDDDRFANLYQFAKLHNPGFDRRIEECRHGGTLFHNDFIIELIDIYLRRQTLQIPDGLVDADLAKMALDLREKDAMQSIAKNMRYPIFYDCCNGCLPYSIWPYYFSFITIFGSFSVGKTVVEMFANNPQLFRQFLDSYTKRGDTESKEALKVICFIIKTTYASTYPTVKNDEDRNKILQRFENFIQSRHIDLVDAGDQDRIGAFLANYCIGVLFYERGSYNVEEDMYDLSDPKYSTVIISQSYDPDIEIRDDFVMLLEHLKTLGFVLMMINFTEHITDIKFLMRWKLEFAWQTDDYGCNTSRIVENQDDLEVYGKYGQLLVFQRDPLHIKTINLDMKRMTGCQNLALCYDHSVGLIRESMGSTILCCIGVNQCFGTVAYRCPDGLRSGIQCDIGICHKHFRDIKFAGEIISIKRRMLVGACTQRMDPVFVNNRKLLQLKIDVSAKRLKENSLVSRNHDEGQVLDENGNRKSAVHWLLNTFFRMRPTRAGRLQTPVNAQGILQAIASTSTDNRVPLIAPEGMLFPSIFWYTIGKSIVGAMPYTMYCTGAESRAIQPWLASFYDHIAVRMRDQSLLTSQDSTYRAHLFDAKVNELSRAYPVTLCLKKGPEVLQETKYKDGVDVNLSDGFFGFDNHSLGTNRAVNQLAAAIRRYGPWVYFVTVTCNDKGTPGVAELTKTIEATYGHNLELLGRVHTALLPMSMMLWDRFKVFLLEWMRSSPDEPFGSNVELFSRDEFQSKGAVGNKNHVHIGVRADVCESSQKMLWRIRNTKQSLFSEDVGFDMQSMVDNGYIKTDEEFFDLQQLWSRVNHHDCKDPTARCHTDHSEFGKSDSNDGKKKCRARRYPNSFHYRFKERHGLFTDESIILLEYVGLTEIDSTDNTMKPIACLRGGSFTYPSFEVDGMQPTTPQLFYACQSSTNVQRCDFKFTLSYMLKYQSGIEERAVVDVTESKSGGIVAETSGVVENIKIGSRKRKRVIENLNANAREIPDTETVKVLLNLPYVVKDIESVHVATTFPEDRAAILKFHTKQKVDPNVKVDPFAITYYSVFQDPMNQFTESQELMIIDWCESDFAVDNTVWFSLRPPLLRVIDSLEVYTESFIRLKLNTKKKLDEGSHILDDCLVDGSFHIIKIRISMLLSLTEFVEKSCMEWCHENSYSGEMLLAMLLTPLSNEYLQLQYTDDETVEYTEFFKRFVDITATKKVAVVFSSIAANQGSKFLYHLLLIYGRFITELDLCCHADFRYWFEFAHIMPMPASEDNIQLLCSKYARDYLIYAPVGHRKWCYNLRFTIDAIRSFFLHGAVLIDGPPLVLQRAMRENYSMELQVMADRELVNLVTALKIECASVGDLPSDIDLMSDRIIIFEPRVKKKRNQSKESFDEQTKAWEIMRDRINNYKESTKSYVHGIIVSGPPGSGKSFLLSLAALYAIAMKLRVMVIALTAARAMMLGGIHLHKFIGFQDRNPGNLSVKSMVQNTLLYLEKHPLVRDNMRNVDVLFIDEGGLFNSQTLSALSQIYGILKNNSTVPFGGMLVMITGDPRQLPPITGKPLWISPTMFTDYHHIVLREYVRAEDIQLQRALRLYYDNTSMSSIVADKITNIIFDGVPAANFHQSCQSLPPGCQFILSKRKGVRNATAEMNDVTKQTLLQWNQDNPLNRKTMFSSVAKDMVEKSSLLWVDASPTVTKFLNDTVAEEETLFIFDTALMRFTYNGISPTGIPFTQGQMCVVLNIDLISNVNEPQLTVAIVPIDVKQVNTSDVPISWDIMIVRPRDCETVYMATSCTRVKRWQYPLVFASACTVHKAIGRTCDSVAIRFSHLNTDDGIWDSRMLYVLVSRVKKLEHLHFIGKMEQCKESFREVLLLPTRWSNLIARTLASLNILNRPVAIRMTVTVHNYKTPSAVGFVYAIISTKVPSLMYIGETGDFGKRLAQHNASHGGTILTNDSQYQPWVPCVLVTGFGDNGRKCSENIRLRRKFEKMWHEKLPRFNGLCNSRRGITLGAEVMDEIVLTEPILQYSLKWVKYCRLESIVD